jgi:hypothetical protein
MKTELTETEVWKLRSDLQDMHHYAALITGQAWSTFEGDRNYGGLHGKLTAYDALRVKVNTWDAEACGHFTDIKALAPFAELKLNGDCETWAEMVREARRAFKAIAAVAKAYECNPNTGEKLPRQTNHAARAVAAAMVERAAR